MNPTRIPIFPNTITARIREFGPHEGEDHLPLDYDELSGFPHGDHPRYEVRAMDSFAMQCSDALLYRRTQVLPIQRVNNAAPSGNGAIPWMAVMFGRERPEHTVIFARFWQSARYDNE